MKIRILAALLLMSHFTFAADLGLSPSSLKLKVYKLSVSTSPLCTDLTTVVDNGATPTEVDFASGSPNLGSGTLADGTYPCIVIEFSDNIKFTPAANSTSGNCSTATEETMDVCRVPSTSVLADGTTTNCTAGADRVAMYLSTGSAASAVNVDAFNPPTSIGDTDSGFTLGAALTVSGDASGKFVVNPAGKVCDGDDGGCDGGGNGGQCRMEPPTFSFSEL
jgi:hypothetical protein